MNVEFQRIKNNKFFRYCCWVVGVIVATLIIFSELFISLLTNTLGKFALIIFALGIFIISVILTILLLLALEWLFNIIDKFIYKNKSDYQHDLFYWLAEDGISNVFLKSILSNEASKERDDISNLINVRKILQKKLEHDVQNYKLFKSYLINRSKKSLFKTLNSFLVTLFVALVIKDQLPKFKEYIQQTVDNKMFIENLAYLITVEGYSNLILTTSFFFVLYFTVYRLLLRFTEEDRRIKNIISILDNLIEGNE